jgi:hypothetical protein
MSMSALKRSVEDLSLPLAQPVDAIDASAPLNRSGQLHGSPVHAMQAQLEEAVFASFSAKEDVPVNKGKGGELRAAGLILAASLAGWGIFMAGASLKVY